MLRKEQRRISHIQWRTVSGVRPGWGSLARCCLSCASVAGKVFARAGDLCSAKDGAQAALSHSAWSGARRLFAVSYWRFSFLQQAQDCYGSTQVTDPLTLRTFHITKVVEDEILRKTVKAQFLESRKKWILRPAVISPCLHVLLIELMERLLRVVHFFGTYKNSVLRKF